jgi:hypothetical protein
MKENEYLEIDLEKTGYYSELCYNITIYGGYPINSSGMDEIFDEIFDEMFHRINNEFLLALFPNLEKEFEIDNLNDKMTLIISVNPFTSYKDELNLERESD